MYVAARRISFASPWCREDRFRGLATEKPAAEDPAQVVPISNDEHKSRRSAQAHLVREPYSGLNVDRAGPAGVSFRVRMPFAYVSERVKCFLLQPGELVFKPLAPPNVNCGLLLAIGRSGYLVHDVDYVVDEVENADEDATSFVREIRQTLPSEFI